MASIPDPTQIYANEYGTTCYLKNIVKASNIHIGDYTYYDDSNDHTQFETRNVLFNYPEYFPDQLIIGKFCAIAQGVQFMMGAANHRTASISTYPFNVMGGLWREKTTPHVSELPLKGRRRKFYPASKSVTAPLSEHTPLLQKTLNRTRWQSAILLESLKNASMMISFGICSNFAGGIGRSKRSPIFYPF